MLTLCVTDVDATVAWYRALGFSLDERYPASGPIGWAALIFAVPIWTLVTSVWLFASKEPEAAQPAVAV